jgi:hypothetical protein
MLVELEFFWNLQYFMINWLLCLL